MQTRAWETSASTCTTEPVEICCMPRTSLQPKDVRNVQQVFRFLHCRLTLRSHWCRCCFVRSTWGQFQSLQMLRVCLRFLTIPEHVSTETVLSTSCKLGWQFWTTSTRSRTFLNRWPRWAAPGRGKHGSPHHDVQGTILSLFKTGRSGQHRCLSCMTNAPSQVKQ